MSETNDYKEALKGAAEELEMVFDGDNLREAIRKPKHDEKKKLKIIEIIATTLSLSGVFLNASKIIWCWPLWCVANGFWIYWSAKKGAKWQMWLWIVFTLANLYGWYMWSI